MLEGIDPTTLFGATGAASLVLYIIWTDKATIKELKVLLGQAIEKKETAQKETADLSIGLTEVMKDMELTIGKVTEDNERIQSALQLILSKT